MSGLERGRPLRQTEQRPRRLSTRAGEPCEALPARTRDRGGDVRKIRRFVAPRDRSGNEVARQQVRTVGLQQQPLGGYVPDEGEQMRAAALIADPAGDADRQSELEVAVELGAGAGEAVRDAAPLRRVLAQDGDEVGVGIALVQEHRFAEPQGELELQVEGLLLRLARGEVAEVVEPALPDRDHPTPSRQLLKLRNACDAELGGMVRMYARGGKQPPRVRARQLAGGRAACEARPGDHHLRNTGLLRAREHRVAIGIVTVMCEIDADVDERRGGGRQRGCVMVVHAQRAFYGGERQQMRPGSTHDPRRAPWLAGAALALLSAGSAAAEEAAWRDFEGRIQYGYYTEDARALHNLADAIAADESHDKLHGYYAALTEYRLAQLAAQGLGGAPGESAAQLAQRCVAGTDAALAVQADFAEALALRAACLAMPLAGGGLHTPFAGHRARKDLERALQLAPRNPRVLLVDGMSDYQLAPSAGGNRERALPKLRLAVAAFDSERGAAEHVPGWGAAEAYLFLARDLLDHADPIGARDALERALLIAPQFTQARRLLAKVISG